MDLNWEIGKAGCALIREGKEYRKRKKECKIKIGISGKVQMYQAIIYLKLHVTYSLNIYKFIKCIIIKFYI